MTQGPRTGSKIVIPLRRPYGQLLLASLFFAACTAVLWHRAQTNDRGLIINGIIHLETGGADLFYAVLTALSMGFTGLGLVSAYGLWRLREFRVVIGRTTLKMPPARYFGLAGEVSIPITEILRVETYPADAPRALIVCTEDGRFGLDKRVLPGGHTIPELAGAIIARVREANAPKEAAPGK